MYPFCEPYLDDHCDEDDDIDTSYDKELIEDSKREEEAFENE